MRLGHPLASGWWWRLEILFSALVQHDGWMHLVNADTWCVFANLSLGLCRKPLINSALLTSSLKFCIEECRGKEAFVRMVRDVSGCTNTEFSSIKAGWTAVPFPTLLWKSSRSAVVRNMQFALWQCGNCSAVAQVAVCSHGWHKLQARTAAGLGQCSDNYNRCLCPKKQLISGTAGNIARGEAAQPEHWWDTSGPQE